MWPDSNSEISISHVGSFLTTVQGGGFQSVASGLRYQLLVSFQLFTPKQETSDAGFPQKPQKKTKIIHRKWQRGRPTDTGEIRADSAAGLSELGGVFYMERQKTQRAALYFTWRYCWKQTRCRGKHWSRHIYSYNASYKIKTVHLSVRPWWDIHKSIPGVSTDTQIKNSTTKWEVL